MNLIIGWILIRNLKKLLWAALCKEYWTENRKKLRFLINNQLNVGVLPMNFSINKHIKNRLWIKYLLGRIIRKQRRKLIKKELIINLYLSILVD